MSFNEFLERTAPTNPDTSDTPITFSIACKVLGTSPLTTRQPSLTTARLKFIEDITGVSKSEIIYEAVAQAVLSCFEHYPEIRHESMEKLLNQFIEDEKAEDK